jgi:hypothetical protein
LLSPTVAVPLVAAGAGSCDVAIELLLLLLGWEVLLNGFTAPAAAAAAVVESAWGLVVDAVGCTTSGGFSERWVKELQGNICLSAAAYWSSAATATGGGGCP